MHARVRQQLRLLLLPLLLPRRAAELLPVRLLLAPRLPAEPAAASALLLCAGCGRGFRCGRRPWRA